MNLVWKRRVLSRISISRPVDPRVRSSCRRLHFPFRITLASTDFFKDPSKFCSFPEVCCGVFGRETVSVSQRGLNFAGDRPSFAASRLAGNGQPTEGLFPTPDAPQEPNNNSDCRQERPSNLGKSNQHCVAVRNVIYKMFFGFE